MSDTLFELAARPGHTTAADLVAYAGIGLGIALHTFAGHPTSTALVARAEVYFQQGAVAAPGFPTQFAGLRFFKGSVQELSLVALADAPTGNQWRINKNGTDYAVYLVDTTDPNASHVRVQTSSGVKAARLKT